MGYLNRFGILDILSLASGIYLAGPMLIGGAQLAANDQYLLACLMFTAGIAVLFLPEYITSNLFDLKSRLSSAKPATTPSWFPSGDEPDNQEAGRDTVTGVNDELTDEADEADNMSIDLGERVGNLGEKTETADDSITRLTKSTPDIDTTAVRNLIPRDYADSKDSSKEDESAGK